MTAESEKNAKSDELNIIVEAAELENNDLDATTEYDQQSSDASVLQVENSLTNPLENQEFEPNSTTTPADHLTEENLQKLKKTAFKAAVPVIGTSIAVIFGFGQVLSADKPSDWARMYILLPSLCLMGTSFASGVSLLILSLNNRNFPKVKHFIEFLLWFAPITILSGTILGSAYFFDQVF